MMETREPFNKDVDKILERYGLDVPAWAMLASDLADLFDSVQAENERLREALSKADKALKVTEMYVRNKQATMAVVTEAREIAAAALAKRGE